MAIDPDPYPQERAVQRVEAWVRLCAALVMTIAVVALLGWVLGVPALASLGGERIPMAPSTAIAFVLIAAVTLLRARPAVRSPLWLETVILSAVTIAALALLFLSSRGVYLGVEHWGFTVHDPEQGPPVGHMSPATAFCFLLAALSYWALRMHLRGSRRWGDISAGLACALTSLGFVIVLAYVYGAPLLSGGAVIPPAATTGLSFLLLGAALFGLPRQRGGRTDDPAESPHRGGFFLMLIFVGLAACIVLAGRSYSQRFEREYRSEIERQLTAIADLKVSDLVQWRKERLGDGSVFFRNQDFSGLVRRFLDRPDDVEAESRIRIWLGQVRGAYEYDRLLIVDGQGQVRLTEPASAEPAAPHPVETMLDVLRSKKVAFLDFHRDAPNLPVHLAVAVPILGGADADPPIGLLVLRIDPGVYLYPFIERWPGLSKTAETLLVRREDGEVVFLNELRFKRNTALNLRYPVDHTDLPAAKAVLGQEGIVEGLDYREVPVLACLRAIPDSPWRLVARMDLSEVRAPMQQRLWILIGFVCVFLVAAAAVLGLLWRQQHVVHYRERYEDAEALRKQEERYHRTLDDMMEGCQIVDREWRYIYVNDATALYGRRTKAELIGRTMMECYPGIEATTLFAELRRCMEDRSVRRMENDFTYPDGDKAWFDLNIQPVPEGLFILAVDITQRKHAEERLRHLTEVLRAVRNVNQLITHEKDRAALLRRSCEILTETRGFRSAWIATLDAAGQLQATAESGIGAGFATIQSEMGRGQWPECCRLAIERPHVVTLHSTETDCARCPVAHTYRDTAAMAHRLFHAGRTYGVLVVALPASLADDSEEQALFEEVAGDIGYALYAIEMEEAHRRLEEETRSSKAFLEIVIDMSPFAMWISDSSGTVTRVNRSLCEAIALPAEAILGKYNVLADKNLEVQGVMPLVKAVFERHEPAHFSIPWMAANAGAVDFGSARDMHIDAAMFPIVGARGQLTHVVCQWIDVTARKQAEGALRESEALFRSLLEEAPEGVFVQSGGRFEFLNPAMLTLLGAASADALLGTEVMDRIAPEYHEAVRQRIRMQRETGKSVPPMEQVYVRLDGSKVHVETTAVGIRYQGRDAHLVFVRDISERKLAEQALLVSRRQNEFLAGILERSAQPFAVAYPDGRLGIHNQAFCDLTGYASDEFPEIGWSRMLTPHEWDELDALALKRLEEQNEPVRYEKAFIRKDGSRVPVELFLHATKDTEGDVLHYHAFVTDITERKRAQEEMERLNRALRIISECNEVLVRTADESELLQRVCDLIRNIGGYGLVWVGFLEDGEFRNVRPVAWSAQDSGYIERIRVTWDDSPLGRGPTGAAIRTGKPVFIRDTQTDPTFSPWREAAAGYGYHSVISLPLQNLGKRLGALLIYADHVDAFDEREVRLLAEMADDLAYGISSLRSRAEQKRAEADLAASEARYRTLFDAGYDAVLLFPITADGRPLKFVEANERACEMLGYTRDELLALSPADTVAPEYRETMPVIGRKLVQEGHARVLWEDVAKDGRRIPVDVSVTSFNLAGQSLSMAVIRDITEQRHAEKELRRSEEKFSAAFRGAPVLMSINDMIDGRFIDVNEMALTLSGFTRDDVIGKTPLELGWMSEDDLVHLLQSFRSQGHVADAEFVFHGKEGREVVCLYSGEHIVVDGVPCLLSIAQDISERRRAEDAVRASEVRYRTLFDEATEGIGLADAETGVILDCNRALTELTGYTREDLIGKSQALLHPRQELQEGVSHTFALHRTDQRGSVLPTDLVTKSGEAKQVEIKANVIEVGGRRVVQAFFRDVTEEQRHRHERETTVRLLQLLNEQNDVHELVRGITVLLQEWSGCEAVGVRLREQDDFPYLESRGFGSEFLRLETSLCARDENGQIIRDDQGSPVLACSCGDVLHGRFDPSWPFCTSKGSFWTNSTSELLAALPGLVHRPNARNRCIHEGYESVALIPLRSGGQTLGLLQLNDHAKGRFNPDLLAFLESAADQFAIALAQRQAQKGLSQSEERYRALVESAPDAIVVYNEDGILYANSVAIALCGLESFEQLQEKGILRVIHPDERAGVAERMRRGLGRHDLPVRETRLVRPDGSEVFIETVGRPIYFEGRPAVQVFVRDITRRMQDEEQLRKLSAAVTQSPAMVMITDLKGEIEYVNPRFTEVTGYSQEEVRGRNPRILRSGETPPEEYEALWEALAAGGEWRGEFHNRKKDGSLYWERAFISPIRNAAGAITHLIAIKEDISKQKAMEEQYRQAQKMEAVGQLAGGVAHDFNNVLQAIVGYGGMLLGHLSEMEPTHEYAEEIVRAAERASGLTRQLLAFSRRQVLEMEDLNLNEVIQGVMKMICRVIGEDIEVRVMEGHGLGATHADRGQMEQVLLNLSVNARDAMPEGGQLVIETENVVVDQEYCDRHAWATPGRYVLLSVTDTGCGMDVQTQERIFEPFFTTKELGKGTGLGLATVYGIVRQHQGMIEVYSEVGKGTTFKVYLPSLGRKATTVGTKVVRRVRGGTETVLVAEDDEVVRTLAARILEDAGYTVLLATDGLEAVQIFRQHAAEISLAVLDVVMPGMGGKAVYDSLTPEYPHVRFLFSSGYSANAIHANFVLKEGIDLIQKPYSAEALLRKVREALERTKPKEETS